MSTVISPITGKFNYCFKLNQRANVGKVRERSGSPFGEPFDPFVPFVTEKPVFVNERCVPPAYVAVNKRQYWRRDLFIECKLICCH